MDAALFWLLFSSSLIGFGYFLISKILEFRNKDEDENEEDNNDTEN